jgi:2-dehydro-3-deoxyphosphogluconate aldolase/(4S)-4-hydroxy-2-oxoglutarate aldolase
MMTYREKEQDVARRLRACRIVPVLALESVEDGLRLAEVLCRAGLPVAEITFRTAAAEAVIKAVTKEFPQLFVGAGTVLNVVDLHRAFDAGAAFAVAPGFNPTVVREAVACGLPFSPGVSCPTHIEQAVELGPRLLKFFPAEAAGGVKMLNAMIPPYRHLGIEIMPTGGINPGNLASYLAIPQVVAVGGTWLGAAADIKAGRWDEIEKTIREAVALTK